MASGMRAHTRPYTPRTNGKAKRFIQTLLREWAYAYRYPTSQPLRPQGMAQPQGFGLVGGLQAGVDLGLAAVGVPQINRDDDAQIPAFPAPVQPFQFRHVIAIRRPARSRLTLRK